MGGDPEALALLLDVALQELDVGSAAGRVRLQLLQLGQDAGASLVLGPAGLLLGLGVGPCGRVVGLGQHAGRLVLGGRHVRAARSSASRMAASAVRWASTSVRFSVSSASPPPPGPQLGVLGPAFGFRGASLGGRDALAGFAELGVLAVDRDREALQELVDVLGVVAACFASRNSTSWSTCAVRSMRAM